MYVSVRNYAGNRDLADALVNNEAEIRNILTAIDGFRAYYLVRTLDSTVSVSVFDDADGAEESNRQAAEWLRENLPDLAVAAPQISAGDVLVAF
jgi:hypothetical protein